MRKNSVSWEDSKKIQGREDPRWRAGPFLGASRKEGEVHEAVYMHKCWGTGGQEGKEACWWNWRVVWGGGWELGWGTWEAWRWGLRSCLCSQTSLPIPHQALQPLSFLFPPRLPQDPPMTLPPTAVHQWMLCSLQRTPHPPRVHCHKTSRPRVSQGICIWPQGRWPPHLWQFWSCVLGGGGKSFYEKLCVVFSRDWTPPHLLKTLQWRPVVQRTESKHTRVASKEDPAWFGFCSTF